MFRYIFLDEELDYQLAEESLRLTNLQEVTDEQIGNPLIGFVNKAVRATVHEYLSHDMGLLKLVGGDHGVVMFHLGQVWEEYTDYSSNAVVRHMRLQERPYVPLKEHLPIGSHVMVREKFFIPFVVFSFTT